MESIIIFFICFYWRLNAIIGYAFLMVISLCGTIFTEDNFFKLYGEDNLKTFWDSWNHHLKHK